MSALFLVLHTVYGSLEKWYYAANHKNIHYGSRESPVIPGPEFFKVFAEQFVALALQYSEHEAALLNIAALMESIGVVGYESLREYPAGVLAKITTPIKTLQHKLVLEPAKGVLITDPDALEKLASVEGPQWLSEQTGPNYHSSDLRFDSVKEAFAKGGHNEFSAVGVIYGAGGWHRYFVRHTGQIVYSGYHGPDHVRLAQAVGFHTSN